MESHRPYVQRRRAEASRATGGRILDAMAELVLESGELPTLEAVAARAGVTVQTVLRRFGSKQQLFEAAITDASARVDAQRGAAPVGDPAGAVANLLEHYAEWGDTSLRMLALEPASPAAGRVVTRGRALHREWVERVFAPQLAHVPEPERTRRVTQLVAATDVYVWKLLHHDLGLEAAELEATLADLVRRILA